MGESSIAETKKKQNCRIQKVRLLPEHPPVLKEAVHAIAEADMIVFAPGSLYTSIIPNLLVDGIQQAIRSSKALKIYACNIMTETGETDGYTVSDHIRAFFRHTYPGLFHVCLVNSEPPPPAIVQRYRQEGSDVILCDHEACEALGVEIISAPVVTIENGKIRHNPGHLARELIRMHADRNIRIAGKDRHEEQFRTE